MSSQKTGQTIHSLVQAAFLVFLVLACVQLPTADAASASFSQSGSYSATPSFSGSVSVSYSATQSYSGTAASTFSSTVTYTSSLTFTVSLLFSRSSPPSISATFGTSPPPPAGLYRFENHCPYQSTSICPFWQPNVFSSYRLTVMNASGVMLTYDNIKVPSLEVPQYPMSYDSTQGFIQPAGTYRLQLFGCNPGQACIEFWQPLVVTLNPRRKPVCDPNYLCKVYCKVSSPGVVTCTWVNQIVQPKRFVLKAITCYTLNTFTLIPLSRTAARTITTRNPRPAPTTISLNVPTPAICSVTFIARYHPTNPKNIVFRYDFFT